MSVEQLKAKLSEAREKYNQIVAATQAQGESVKEIEQRIKVLNQMVEKAKQSKTTLNTEIERLDKEKKNKTKQLQRASDTKCQLLAEEIQKVEKDAAEKEQIYLTLQTRYKILQERWEHKENEYLSKIYELEQNYSLIRAKTNEVINRIQGMSPPRRPGFLFNPVPEVFPDFTNLFAPTNLEEEFNSSGSGDATFELELEDEDQNEKDQESEQSGNYISEPDYDLFNSTFQNNFKNYKYNWMRHSIPANRDNKNPSLNLGLNGNNSAAQNNVFNSPGLFSARDNFAKHANEFIEEEDDDALIGEITNIDEEDEEEEGVEKNSMFLHSDLLKMRIKNPNSNDDNSTNDMHHSIETLIQQQKNHIRRNEFLSHLSENKQVHNLTEKVSQLSLQERKLTLEKLKLECRLLQHQRDDLMNEMKKQNT